MSFKGDLRLLRQAFPDLVIVQDPTCFHTMARRCDVYVNDPTHPYHRVLDPLDGRQIRVGNPLLGSYRPGDMIKAAAKLAIFRRAQQGGL